ncbi:MAG: hypothetical protein CM15mP36_10990 [Flavobacteriales bacterium]|nr:MAG: hypothetical protein CM15mP36_10990 [Flavobacteriales bacterium]
MRLCLIMDLKSIQKSGGIFTLKNEPYQNVSIF